MDPSVCAKHKQLQTAFQCVTEQFELWKSLERSTRSSLKQLVHVSEQLQSVSKAQLSGSQLLLYDPTVQERLMHKLDTALDTGLDDITHALDVESGIVSELLQQYQQALERCNSGDDLLDDAGSTGEWPSVACMLQALHNIHALCFNIHHEREYHVEEICWTSEESVDRLVRSWQEQSQLTDTVEDILAKLHYHQKETFKL